MNKQIEHHYSGAAFLFFILIAVEVCFTCFQILSHRIPGGFDGFQYFHLQYFFLNHKIIYGEIPQWMPYLTQGTVSTWWYSIQAGPAQAAMLVVPFGWEIFLEDVDFLALFHWFIFLEKCLLLTGTWLLAGRLVQTHSARFFITLTVMGSCVWMLQIWYNFHFYYALPFIFYFGHRFIDTARWRYFLMLVFLTYMQTLGNLPYMLPPTKFVIFAYFLFYTLFNTDVVAAFFKKIKWGFAGFLSIVFSMFILYCAFKVVSIDTDMIVNYNYGRLLDARTTVEGFLSYGMNLGLKKWIESVTGLSPFWDFTLFFGVPGIMMFLMGLISGTRRRNAHVLITGLCVLLFSMGTFVAVGLFHTWPMMHYFRHLALLSPIIKLMLCLIAGFGVDAVVKHNTQTQVSILKTLVTAVLMIGCFTLAGFFWHFAKDPAFVTGLLSKIPQGGSYVADHVRKLNVYVPGLPSTLTVDGVREMMFHQMIVYTGTGGILAVFLAGLGQRRFYMFTAVMLCLLQGVNLYYYRYQQTLRTTYVLQKDERDVAAFGKMPFYTRRIKDLVIDSPRIRLLYRMPFRAYYWSVYSFIYKDQVGSHYRTDHWLKPLDDFIRAYEGLSLNDRELVPKSMQNYNEFVFPDHPAALKLSGYLADKIQFFKKAYQLQNKERIAEFLSAENSIGEQLYLYLGSDQPKISGAVLSAPTDPSSSDRISIPHEIKDFHANGITVLVDNQSAVPVWMMYSDVFHPHWHAFIDGERQPLFKANLAYKAVQIPPGKREVSFLYHSPRLTEIQTVWGIFGWFWILLALCMTLSIL
ncbi:MAG: hypothetical protein KC713_00975, partial [Candidatus Omnitrophica bacterium]|nr:hypothetical protein [Candidatus Omnitrophota bacterium]